MIHAQVLQATNIHASEKTDITPVLRSSPQVQDLEGTNTTVTRKTDFTAMDAVSLLDLRVGTIVAARHHPTFLKLLVEELDVGGDDIIEIVSGIGEYYAPENLVGRKVVVLINVQERKMGDIVSHGLLLCTTSGCVDDTTSGFVDDTIAGDCASLSGSERKAGTDFETADGSGKMLVEAPKSSRNGERVLIGGMDATPVATKKKVKKHKLFEKAVKHFRTNDQGVFCFEDLPFVTSAGPCAAVSIPCGAEASTAFQQHAIECNVPQGPMVRIMEDKMFDAHKDRLKNEECA